MDQRVLTAIEASSIPLFDTCAGLAQSPPDSQTKTLSMDPVGKKKSSELADAALRPALIGVDFCGFSNTTITAFPRPYGAGIGLLHA